MDKLIYIVYTYVTHGMQLWHNPKIAHLELIL